MKILTESGLVKGVRDGAWMRYTVWLDEKVLMLKQFIADLTDLETGDAVRFSTVQEDILRQNTRVIDSE